MNSPGEDAKNSEKSEIQAYEKLLHELKELQHTLKRLETDSAETLADVSPGHIPGAINLVHYLGLRRRDMRNVQERLAAVGLSSLGRSESHVLSNLHSITTLLQHALKLPVEPHPLRHNEQALSDSDMLKVNTDSFFGNPPKNRQVRIMVTLPSESADNYALVEQMLKNGMDCARINCAHDGQEAWKKMIRQIKAARRKTGRPCKILMDLGGPKLRTGAIAPGPAVVKCRPQRDDHGKVTSPSRIWLYPEAEAVPSPAPADACIPFAGNWLELATVSDRVELTDARDAKRSMKLVSKHGKGYWAEASHTIYFKPELELRLVRVPASGRSREIATVGKVGALPNQPGQIVVQLKDSLIITREDIPGLPAQYDKKGRLFRAASISCSLPEVFTSVKPGERLLIDDGRIGAVIRKVSRDEIVVEIVEARAGGEKLLSDKGINLPDSQLKLEGLTEQDVKDLPFIARNADMVGLSFVRRPSDIRVLQHHLKKLEKEKLGIVLKVETRAAFECLPELLFTLMRSPNVGVMIARGDLAVECGYERMAELQEEIMWLAEAAHLPVIWATQVLEELAKSGKPSRAEITDAAMSERAECVMLNKGSHILEAIQTLDDILQRMQGHQQKKSSLLRRLHW